jgi:hypothetical protein
MKSTGIECILVSDPKQTKALIRRIIQSDSSETKV